MIDRIIDLALEEDLGLGDITTDYLLNGTHFSSGEIITKSDLVVCGINVAIQVFNRVNPNIQIIALVKDGDKLKAKTPVLQIKGDTRSILQGERVALNFMQRLSGISTMANRYVEKVASYNVKVCDTRKSTPGMRRLEKYAVRCGGAYNHRVSLADSVMIKDNHIQAMGSITKAVEMIKTKLPHISKIEVETKNLNEVQEAINVGVDIIMFDNMNVEMVKSALSITNNKVITEVSGGINLNTIEDYAKTGVNVISVGALTHSVPAADLSLNLNIGINTL